jgi:hypothetical protein
MNARQYDLVSALERAARGSDEGAFDAAFDRLLERAHDAANPSADLRALVGTRLLGELAAVNGGASSELADVASESSAAVRVGAREFSPANPADAERASPMSAGERRVTGERVSGRESPLPHAKRGRVEPGRGTRASVTGSVSHAVRLTRGLALVSAGVAIGFVWGRAPLWWPSEAEPERRTRSVEAARALERTAHELPEARSDSTALREPPPATPDGSTRPSATPSPSRSLAPVAAPSNTGGTPASAPKANSSSALASPRAHDAPPRAHTRAERSAIDGAASEAVRHAATPSSASSADALRFALEQLRRAQLFLRAGEPARALEALDALDARVEAAVLRDEREVMRALALCDAGDETRATELAQRVLARAPDSAYAASLRESCAGRAALLEQMRERTSNPPR